MPLSKGQKDFYENIPQRCVDGDHLWKATETGKEVDTETCFYCPATRKVMTCVGYGNHRWRGSDASTFDYMCRDCGAVD